jgi:PleD family two-component response regulator
MSEPAATKRLIVIADNEPVAREAMKAALEGRGYQVEVAENGAMACAAFVEHDPEIIILNIALPIQDGLSACKEIRRLPGGESTPIVLVSDSADTAAAEEAYRAGATDFVTKPINWAVFGYRLEYFLRVSNDYQNMCKAKKENSLLLNAMPDTFVVLNADNIVADFIPGKLENPLPEPATRKASVSDFLPKNVAKSWCDARALASKNGKPIRIEFTLDAADKRISYYEARFVPYTDRRTLAMVSDITARKLSEKRIRRLAFYDSLTGLPNRQAFRLQLSGMIDEAVEVGDRVAVLYIDLDNFKRINDTLGHTIGDGVLNAIAERLSNSIRNQDQLPHTEEFPTGVARLGGDEFACAISGFARVRRDTQYWRVHLSG